MFRLRCHLISLRMFPLRYQLSDHLSFRPKCPPRLHPRRLSRNDQPQRLARHPSGLVTHPRYRHFRVWLFLFHPPCPRYRPVRPPLWQPPTLLQVPLRFQQCLHLLVVAQLNQLPMDEPQILRRVFPLNQLQNPTFVRWVVWARITRWPCVTGRVPAEWFPFVSPDRQCQRIFEIMATLVVVVRPSWKDDEESGATMSLTISLFKRLKYLGVISREILVPGNTQRRNGIYSRMWRHKLRCFQGSSLLGRNFFKTFDSILFETVWFL